MDYLLHGISWGAVQRMLIDAPGYADSEDGKQGESIVLSDENADEVLNLINRINR